MYLQKYLQNWICWHICAGEHVSLITVNISFMWFENYQVQSIKLGISNTANCSLVIVR